MEASTPRLPLKEPATMIEAIQPTASTAPRSTLGVIGHQPREQAKSCQIQAHDSKIKKIKHQYFPNRAD
jgi:hypothetical protein